MTVALTMGGWVVLNEGGGREDTEGHFFHEAPQDGVGAPLHLAGPACGKRRSVLRELRLCLTRRRTPRSAAPGSEVTPGPGVPVAWGAKPPSFPIPSICAYKRAMRGRVARLLGDFR